MGITEIDFLRRWFRVLEEKKFYWKKVV